MSIFDQLLSYELTSNNWHIFVSRKRNNIIDDTQCWVPYCSFLSLKFLGLSSIPCFVAVLLEAITEQHCHIKMFKCKVSYGS